MNKILIGALAGLADLSLLSNAVKTKSEAEWFFNQGHGYGNSYGHGYGHGHGHGHSHMNGFFGSSFFNNLPSFNNNFAPNNQS